LNTSAILCNAVAIAVLLIPAAGLGAPSERPINFTARGGESTAAFEGTFNVPENRADPRSRTLTLHYVRFPATGPKPGSPIVYLAGGPGGSGIGTARDRRFGHFARMREFGDVIAFDQRGTGASNDAPECISSRTIPSDEMISDAQDLSIRKAALSECLEFWRGKKIDVFGYTTSESAADLDALRAHLGAQKISLWGISYGTHLALAAVKQMGDRLDRIVLASVEGLDQTVKLPARTDAYFSRLQIAIDGQPKAKESLPDIAAMIRRVHARLDKTPLRITLPRAEGKDRVVVIQRRDLQQMAAAMVADPQIALNLLGVYAALDNGITAPLADVLKRHFDPDKPVSFEMMPWMMDLASSTGADRRKLILEQARTALLGSRLNDTFHFEGIVPRLDLGDDFRKAPVSKLPVLVLSGTLDGRTYIESQHEAVTGFPNRQLVTVRNGGHNVFESSPDVMHAVGDFMRGDNVDGREINAPLPDFWPW
jgi:pimeloyl-ACP methyl ester carboxylesterase